VEEQKVRLLDMNQRFVEMMSQQADRRVAVLNDYVKRRGLELKRQGELMVSTVEGKTEPSSSVR
jgi:hypothetical protein